MPRIFDNIGTQFLPALKESILVSKRGDFCVGYFNLRGWKLIDSAIETWKGGPEGTCRLLVGMQKAPDDELREAMGFMQSNGSIDQQSIARLKRAAAEEFRSQLIIGVPSNEDESGLRRLRHQLTSKKLIVRLYLRHTLHAKLYLLHRSDPNNPIVGFLGSSNLTFSGLAKQGELNVDVLDHDACQKLEKWFNDRWNDRWCIDISDDLVSILDESWAREHRIPPYHIYLKIAYQLSREARNGLAQFQIPDEFKNQLFDFQSAAVKIAAQYLNRHGGVLLGDVVGLGKTIMACAIAKIFQDDYGSELLIICPKNLVPMWADYVHRYRILAHVLPLSQTLSELPEIRRYNLVLIDESHNLRNKDGKRFKCIQQYILKNESKCILLSATPYNKTYLDLSSQLRLFIPENKDLGIRPENMIRQIGESEFLRQHQCPPRSLAAFEKSEILDDWRELMRLFMVRRTRSFIQDNYAKLDPMSQRKYLEFSDGTRAYFPLRVSKTLKYPIQENGIGHQYSILLSNRNISRIEALRLPRYSLGNYVIYDSGNHPSPFEQSIIASFLHAGNRLSGFCRSTLFKRLESGGPPFLKSIERHVLRNYVFLHAIEGSLEIPIGTQDDDALYQGGITSDLDADWLKDDINDPAQTTITSLDTEEDFKNQARVVYQYLTNNMRTRFKWLRSSLFSEKLMEDLHEDALTLQAIIKECGKWDISNDPKIQALSTLIGSKHKNQKVIVFTQFADTVEYLTTELRSRGMNAIEGVTGSSIDPSAIAWRFSPISNNRRSQVSDKDELRVVITTDVLSEGLNLQDCSIVINFDLPWAIIRLIQRAGRIDRIGQNAGNVLCYSFLPADGIERILRLRARVRERLRENAELVGSDEEFFDDESQSFILDIYNENSGLLETITDSEVDLASYAYQIWRNAIDANPSLEKITCNLPNVVYSTKKHMATKDAPNGVIVYAKTAQGADSLALIDINGKSVTQSQIKILDLARCNSETEALEKNEKHHELVEHAVRHITVHATSTGGQLGRPSGARFKVYERLKTYLRNVRSFSAATEHSVALLEKALEEIYQFSLNQSAIDIFNRQLKAGISDDALANLILALREEDRLCLIHSESDCNEPQVICSLGLFDT